MAETAKLEIETQRLQSDIDSLTQYLSAMKKTGQEMMSGITALGSMWEGEAKEAFTMQFSSDYSTLESMEEIIEELISDLSYAKEQYVKCENSVSSVIDGIKV